MDAVTVSCAKLHSFATRSRITLAQFPAVVYLSIPECYVKNDRYFHIQHPQSQQM
jgi:hypothetical protein